ncbi:MAG: VOC family protein [Thiohalocapsa sp.]
MSTTSHFAAGSFCWVDLATTDPRAATAFYTDIFGWAAYDVPTDQGVPYTMLTKGGRKVAALFQLSADMGTHPFWQSYVAVNDVNASSARANALGGRILMPPMDVMKAGRMAVVRDPGGAAFALWQPREHGGADLVNAVGAACWHELQSLDADDAQRFYAGLFGWTLRISESLPGETYRLFHNGARDCAGLMPLAAVWGPVPPNWAIYFGVSDCDATIAAAQAGGGKLLSAVMDIERVGRFVTLQDPQGAAFSIIQFTSEHD